jgi:hypothetical protein
MGSPRRQGTGSGNAIRRVGPSGAPTAPALLEPERSETLYALDRILILEPDAEDVTVWRYGLAYDAGHLAKVAYRLRWHPSPTRSR